MSLGSALAAVLVFAWSRISSVLELYLVFAGLGVAMALVLYEPAFIVVTKWFNVRRRAALTTLTLIAAFASFIFSPLTQSLQEAHGWRHALAVLALVLAVVTLLVGWVTFGQVRTTVAAPPNLRSIHPAPPPEITFRGKTMTLAGLENPLRQPPESVATYTAQGKEIYYQNCLPCHGDHLDGLGHFAAGFNPLPANFQDNGTIAQLTESFVFWRVAKGGPGLPREGTPWNSAMPRWEDFLTERQIWAVILFLYDQTGWKPRTWEKAEAVGGAK